MNSEQAKKIDALLEKVTQFILDRQMENGSWPMRAAGHEPNTVATSLVLLWLVRYVQYKSTISSQEPLLERAKQSILKGLKYLCDSKQTIKEQGDIAGWEEHSGGGIRAFPTAMAVFALARYFKWKQNLGESLEEAYKVRANKGLNWLKDHTQHWLFPAGQAELTAHDVYWTCTALEESQDVEGLSDTDITMGILQTVFDQIEGHQNRRDGGWGENPLNRRSTTALAPTAYLVYLLRKYSQRQEGEVIQKGLEYVRQKYEGLDMKKHPPVEETARAIISLLQGDGGCESAKIQEGITYLISSYEENTYGWRSFPHSPPDLIAAHNACRALLEYQETCTTQDKSKSDTSRKDSPDVIDLQPVNPKGNNNTHTNSTGG